MKKILSTIFILFLFITGISSAQNNAASKPYVILISFDGFRWNYLNRNITPNLDKIKSEGVSASSLRPAFPSKTFPNHISIITGMYTENHGIISNSFGDYKQDDWYGMKDTLAIRNSKWYLGEAFWETAERQGITTASYFWPGSELHLASRRPTYREQYDHDRPYEERVGGVIDWLKLPIEKRPHFITLYFHDTDSFGHDYGTDSPEVNQAIQRLDGIAGLLFKKLDEIKMRDSVNVIIVSDHGMTNISKERVINIEKMIESYNCKFNDDGPFMQIDPPKEKLLEVYNIIKKNENHYKVFLKTEMPAYYHYNKSPFIYSIIVIADIGWSLIANTKNDWLNKSKGNHGYDNNNLDMHGIFLATGPKFKKSYQTGTVWNVDIYPLLCKIFDIYPRSNIDGSLERIGFILEE